jgi:hypothetical protein
VDEPRTELTDDLSRAQEALARALGRARIGEDRALANQVRELGERLAHLLSGLLRMTRLHSPDNSAFNKPVEDLHTTLVQLNELLGSVHLVAVEDQVYVNDIRIRAGDKASSIRELGTELQRHNAGGITFHLPLDGPGIRALIGALGSPPAPEESRNSLARALHAEGVSGIELQGRFRFRMASEDAAEMSDPRDFVSRALAAADEAFQNLAAGRMPNPLPLRRLVTELLERGAAREELWTDPADASPCTSSASRSSRSWWGARSAWRRASSRTSAWPRSTTTAATRRGRRPRMAWGSRSSGMEGWGRAS